MQRQDIGVVYSNDIALGMIQIIYWEILDTDDGITLGFPDGYIVHTSLLEVYEYPMQLIVFKVQYGDGNAYSSIMTGPNILISRISGKVNPE